MDLGLRGRSALVSAASRGFGRAVALRLAAEGANVAMCARTEQDLRIAAEEVRVAPHREAIRRSLAGVLRLNEAAVSVKATTTDGLGFVGRDEGLAAVVVAVLREG